MTDEADSSVVLAELQVALFREYNNQRLSPWGRPFSCSPDPVTDLCLNIYHGLYYPRGYEMLTNGNQTTVWRRIKSRENRSFLALAKN